MRMLILMFVWIWKIRNLIEIADLFFTVLEQESPQVALEVRTYQVNHAHG